MQQGPVLRHREISIMLAKYLPQIIFSLILYVAKNWNYELVISPIFYRVILRPDCSRSGYFSQATSPQTPLVPSFFLRVIFPLSNLLITVYKSVSFSVISVPVTRMSSCCSGRAQHQREPASPGARVRRR